jgi:hypothetical protein
MDLRPYAGTLSGIGIGLLAIVIWMLTFQPHGGVELSWCLFPLNAIVLERLYPAQSIPASLWYGGALLQWTALGACVDVFRRAFQ